MNPLLIFAISFLAFFAFCSKSNEQPATGLSSTWKETDYYYSIGGPVIWKKTEPGNKEVIRFEEDNVFYSSVHPEFNRYVLEEIDGQTSMARIKLFKSGTIDTTHWFLKTVTPDTIEIAFSGCIEGCGKRFVSVGVE